MTTVVDACVSSNPSDHQFTLTNSHNETLSALVSLVAIIVFLGLKHLEAARRLDNNTARIDTLQQKLDELESRLLTSTLAADEDETTAGSSGRFDTARQVVGAMNLGEMEKSVVSPPASAG